MPIRGQADWTLSSPSIKEQLHTQFFERVSRCDTYEAVNQEITQFNTVIGDNWCNQQDVSCLWEAVIRRLRGISSKYRHSQMGHSFSHYPAIGALINDMKQDIALFNMYTLSYVLCDMAYIIKHEKSAGLAHTSDFYSGVAPSLHKLFSELPGYIESNFANYRGARGRDASGCLGRFYTAIVIAKPLGMLNKTIYLNTTKILLENLNGMISFLGSRVVRESIWCISKGLSEGIHEIGVEKIKLFLDNLLRNSDAVVDRYDFVDVKVVLVSLLKLVQWRRHIYVDHTLCVQHVGLVVNVLVSKEFKDANADDVWAVLLNLVEMKKHFQQLRNVVLVIAYEKLICLSRSKLLDAVSVYNNDADSKDKLLRLFRDVSDQIMGKRVYFHFFNAFFSNFLAIQSTPAKGWSVWHLNHLYGWVDSALSIYLPSFQGDKQMVEEWKNMMLYSWLELFASTMITSGWDCSAAGFDCDRRTGEVYQLAKAYDLFREKFSGGKLKNKFEILKCVSNRRSERKCMNINVARLSSLELDPLYAISEALTRHISDIFRDANHRNQEIVLYGSARLVDYCINGLFNFDADAFFSSQLSLFVNDFDFLLYDRDAHTEVFNKLCELPDSIKEDVELVINQHLIGLGDIMLECSEVRFMYDGRQLAEIAMNLDSRKAIAGGCFTMLWHPYLMFDDFFYINHNPGAVIKLLLPDQQFCSYLMDKSLLSSDWQRKNRTLLNLLTVCFCEKRLEPSKKEWQRYLAAFAQTHGWQILQSSQV